MFLMYLLFSLLLILVILCLICFVQCYLSLEFSIKYLSFCGKFWEIKFNWDAITLFILLMLLICFLYVYFYTPHYFRGDNSGKILIKVIYLFVGVMASLVVTGDFLTTLVFWEYLGVVRFFLILFYSKYLSLHSSIVTLVSSRFGDVCLFLLIALSLHSIGIEIAGLLLFLFIVLTKSARFPFIRWLLEAMRAPTPVSSLVHSSTLVAAGVWFAMRYDLLLYSNSPLLILKILLLLTIFITGICCFFFIDLKKIVALSTCNNISWCVFYLIFGDVILALFQLISHGVSKCMLFMLVGDVMSGTGGSQSSKCVYRRRLYGKWKVFRLFSAIIGLSGAPFIGVFFTKHFLLSGFMGTDNVILLIIVMICVFLSYFYSFRLCAILLNLKASVSCGVLYFFKSRIMLYFWLSIKYLLSSILYESNNLSLTSRLYLTIFQLISCFLSYFFYSRTLLRRWSRSLFGCDNIVEALFSIYNNILNKTILFFYRWDKYSLSLFRGVGKRLINFYTPTMLKILLMFALFIIIILCVFV